MEAYRYYAPDAKIAGPGAIRPGYDQIWVMTYLQEVFDSDNKVRKEVEVMGYKVTGEYSFNGVGVLEYKNK
jgi:hypothetical protein